MADDSGPGIPGPLSNERKRHSSYRHACGVKEKHPPCADYLDSHEIGGPKVAKEFLVKASRLKKRYRTQDWFGQVQVSHGLAELQQAERNLMTCLAYVLSNLRNCTSGL